MTIGKFEHTPQWESQMNYYDDVETRARRELGVTMYCHAKRGGYTEICASGPYPDFPSVFDHSAFSGEDRERELRNALRRHARRVMK